MSAIRIIVGLGNPGPQYKLSRHNVGFMVIDQIAAKLGLEWKHHKDSKGEIAAGKGLLLIKPQTYMNESGRCVGSIMRYYKYSPEQILCIYDEMAFPVGSIKLRMSGSAGGHNGVKSMIAHLSSEQFGRLRIGIGSSTSKDTSSYVLGNFTPDEKIHIAQVIDNAILAALSAVTEGIDKAANTYNTKKERKPKPPRERNKPTNKPASDAEKASSETKPKESAAPIAEPISTPVVEPIAEQNEHSPTDKPTQKA